LNALNDDTPDLLDAIQSDRTVQKRIQNSPNLVLLSNSVPVIFPCAPIWTRLEWSGGRQCLHAMPVSQMEIQNLS
jgi:hypothetical protein